jgi:hypothetical protein
MDVDHEMLDLDDDTMSVGGGSADFATLPSLSQEFSKPQRLDENHTPAKLAFSRDVRASQSELCASNSEASEKNEDDEDKRNPNWYVVCFCSEL